MSITQFYIFILVFLLIILGSMVYFQKTDPNADFRKVIPIGGVALSLLLLPIFSMGFNWLIIGTFSPKTTIIDSQVLERVLYDRSKDSGIDLKVQFPGGDLLSLESTAFEGSLLQEPIYYLKFKGTDVDLEPYEGMIKADDNEPVKGEDLYQITKVSLGTIKVKDNEKDPNINNVLSKLLNSNRKKDTDVSAKEDYISKESYVEVVVEKVQPHSSVSSGRLWK